LKKEKNSGSFIPEVFKNPFSENEFASIWAEWKDYRLKKFNFKYKREQTSINKLSVLSKNDLETAKAIIMRSMANGWKGFFELNKSFDTQKKQNELNNKWTEINYSYKSFLDDKCTVKSIEFDHYDILKNSRLISFTDEQVQNIQEKAAAEINKPIDEIDKQSLERMMKRYAVLEFFEQMKQKGRKTVLYVD